MDFTIAPATVITWMCVIVFVVTSIVALLDLIGWMKVEPESRRTKLFAVLIVAIVGVGVSSFKDEVINTAFNYEVVDPAVNIVPVAPPVVGAVDTYMVCSDSFSCGTIAGIQRELDGGTGGTDPIDLATMICRNNGGEYYSHLPMTKPINCGKNYGLGLIENNKIVQREVPICYLGSVTVIKSITCSE